MAYSEGPRIGEGVNYDPDISHNSFEGIEVFPAGVSPEFDEIEYYDDSVPSDLEV